MNRRKFLKLGAISSSALIGGYVFGNFIKYPLEKNAPFSSFAFLPNNDGTIFQYLNLILEKIKNEQILKTFNNDYRLLLNKQIPLNTNTSFFTNRYLNISHIKLSDKVPTDIVINTNNKILVDPNINYELRLLNFRRKLLSKKGDILLTVEIKENNIIDKLINQENRIATIENKDGVIDKIKLDKNYSSIIVPGKIKDTELKIEDGRMYVNKASCRHKLCQIMSQVNINKTFACVPNNLLIKIS